MVKDSTALYGYVEECDLMSIDKILFPVQQAEHWSLVVARLDEHHIEYYDSLQQDGEEIIKNFTKFFKEISKFAKKSGSRKTMVHKKVDHLKAGKTGYIPRQVKESDSGAFMLSFTNSVIGGEKISFYPD